MRMIYVRIHGVAALAGACALAGCATLQDTPAKEAVVAAAAAVSPQAIANAQRLAGAPGSNAPTPPSPPSSLKTFAEVSRDAKELPGLFRLWQKDEKVWLELAPDQFDHDYFFSTNLDQGLGENRFLAGSMASSLSRRFGGPAIVTFHKVGGNVQMIARNVKYTAQPGTPEARAVADAFSDSLLATAAVASQPHPERKSVLVEANALFFTDLSGAASRLEQAYRQSYAFDARNSSFREVRSTPSTRWAGSTGTTSWPSAGTGPGRRTRSRSSRTCSSCASCSAGRRRRPCRCSASPRTPGTPRRTSSRPVHG